MSNFQRFDEHWSHELNVTRQPERDENFSFVASNVLVMGINLVGGRVHDLDEWRQRMTDDANWVREHFETYRDQVSHAVVFAHAFAGGNRQPFADEFIPAAAAFGHPILYLQGDTHNWVQDQPFRAAPNVTRVIVDSGGVPPVQVTVTDDPNNPFLFDRNPFVPLVLDGSGTTYAQNFDLLGARGTNLPAGWKATTDDGTTTMITQSRLSRVRTDVYNVGQHREEDRALAIGHTASDLPNTIELHAEVRNADIRAWRLAFDVEVWGGDPNISNNPGEAVFDVMLDVNTGDGFMLIKQFGQIGTGVTLIPPAREGLVDGNDSANRFSYDSGVQDIIIPNGSQIRLRWDAQNQGETAGWVFGLDNVVFHAVPEPSALGMALMAAIGVLGMRRRSSSLAGNTCLRQSLSVMQKTLPSLVAQNSRPLVAAIPSKTGLEFSL